MLILGHIHLDSQKKPKRVVFFHDFLNKFIRIEKNDVFTLPSKENTFKTPSEIRNFLSKYSNTIKWYDSSYPQLLNEYLKELESSGKTRETKIAQLAIAKQPSHVIDNSNSGLHQDPQMVRKSKEFDRVLMISVASTILVVLLGLVGVVPAWFILTFMTGVWLATMVYIGYFMVKSGMSTKKTIILLAGGVFSMSGLYICMRLFTELFARIAEGAH